MNSVKIIRLISLLILMVRRRLGAVSNHEADIGASSFETRFALLRMRNYCSRPRQIEDALGDDAEHHL